MSYNQRLFDYMRNEHGLLLLDTELSDIVHIVKETHDPFAIIQDFTNENRKWTDRMFPKANAVSALIHLIEEAKEAVHAIEFKQESVPEEFADIYLLLLNAGSLQGLTFNDIHRAAIIKMRENRKRKWDDGDESGVYRHIPDNDNPPIVDHEIF